LMELKHVQIRVAVRTDPFLKLGADALGIICEMSQPRELISLLVSSRAFTFIADDSRLWIRHILRDFPLISEEQLKWRLSGTTAKAFYLEMAFADVESRIGFSDPSKGVEDCILAGKLWDVFHRHVIPILVPLLTLTITALIVTRLEHSEAHSKAVRNGVQASNVNRLVGDIDHTWVALLWWLLLPILGTGGMSIWYFRVWWRELYADLGGPFKAFVSLIMNDNRKEMQCLCPAWMCILIGLGLFSLRVSNLVLNFSYWWVTFPFMFAPIFLLGWSYQVALGCENVLDIVLGIGTTLFFTFPLVAFTTLLSLHLDGGVDSISPTDVAIPAFISEGAFLIVLCVLFSSKDIRRRHFLAFSSFCVVIPLMIFQVLLLLRPSNDWSYGVTFIPFFIGEVTLLVLGCTVVAKDLQMLPEDFRNWLDPDLSPDTSIL